MTFFDILGWVAAAFGMSGSVPQILRLRRTRTSAGLSTRMWQFSAAATFAWTMHGFLVGAVQMQVPNIVCTVLSLGILAFIVRDRGERFLPRLVLPTVLGLALFGLDLWLGPVVFGTLVALPLVFGQISQLLFMRRSADLSGVSVPTLAVNVLVQALWLTWGIGVGDAAILVCSVLMGTLCVVNLAYYGWRGARGTVGPPVLAEDLAVDALAPAPAG